MIPNIIFCGYQKKIFLQKNTHFIPKCRFLGIIPNHT